MRQIKVFNRPDGEQDYMDLEQFPSECPLCHVAIHPKFISAYFINHDKNDTFFEGIFKCTTSQCGCCFIAKYEKLDKTQNTGTLDTARLRSTYPRNEKDQSFEQEVHHLSPTFVHIYNQAFKAEQGKLRDVAYLGYHKALKCLVKDYLIKHDQLDKNDIATTSVKACIEKYIAEEHIKQIASKAIWLEEMEADYEWKWQDKNMNDLKGLISLTIHWMTMKVKAKQMMA